MLSLLIFESSAQAGQYCRRGRYYYDASSAFCNGRTANYCSANDGYDCGGNLFCECSQTQSQRSVWDRVRSGFSNAVGRIGDVFDNFRSAFTNQSPRRVGRQGGIYEWPSEQVGDQYQLACGSEHIRRTRSRAYMHPLSACMLAGAAQQWRQQVCPDNTPDCQLRFGDMTYGHSMPGHWPHRSHRRGWCVDVWPIRQPGHSGDVVVGGQGYDRERTLQLLRIFREWGADRPQAGQGRGNQVFFDDPQAIREGLARPLRGTHRDHIHVCFRPTARGTEERCNQASFDSGYCPILAGQDPNQQLNNTENTSSGLRVRQGNSAL